MKTILALALACAAATAPAGRVEEEAKARLSPSKDALPAAGEQPDVMRRLRGGAEAKTIGPLSAADILVQSRVGGEEEAPQIANPGLRGLKFAQDDGGGGGGLLVGAPPNLGGGREGERGAIKKRGENLWIQCNAGYCWYTDDKRFATFFEQRGGKLIVKPRCNHVYSTTCPYKVPLVITGHDGGRHSTQYDEVCLTQPECMVDNRFQFQLDRCDMPNCANMEFDGGQILRNTARDTCLSTELDDHKRPNTKYLSQGMCQELEWDKSVSYFAFDHAEGKWSDPICHYAPVGGIAFTVKWGTKFTSSSTTNLDVTASLEVSAKGGWKFLFGPQAEVSTTYTGSVTLGGSWTDATETFNEISFTHNCAPKTQGNQVCLYQFGYNAWTENFPFTEDNRVSVKTSEVLCIETPDGLGSFANPPPMCPPDLCKTATCDQCW